MYLLGLSFLMIISCQGDADHQAEKTIDDSTVVAVETDVEVQDTVVHLPKDGYERSFENPVSDPGIGVIVAPKEVTFFNDENLEKEYKTIKTYEEQPEDIMPFKYAPEDTMMQFICLEHSKRYIKVLINFDEVKYLKWKKAYKLKKWGSYVFQSYGVQRKRDENGTLVMNNQLRKFNNEEAEVIEVPDGNELFCPVKINGDWLKVNYDCNSTEYESHGEELPTPEELRQSDDIEWQEVF